MGLFDRVTLVVDHCITCHAPIYITAEQQVHLKNSGKTFYCLAGHGQSYKGIEARLRKELEQMTLLRDKAKAEVESVTDSRNRAFQRETELERVNRTLRGVITRMKNERNK